MILQQTRAYRPRANTCPPCPSTARNQSEIPYTSHDVVVFENRSFGRRVGEMAADGDLFDSRPGHRSAVRSGPAARLYLDVTRRMAGLFPDGLPAVWCASGTRARRRSRLWLHLEVLTIRRAEGRIKYLAGSESAMGAFVNDITPEVAAQRLRDASGTIGAVTR